VPNRFSPAALQGWKDSGAQHQSEISEANNYDDKVVMDPNRN
jgi:hypothetical protein